ncbi:MAG: transcriptional repressor [Candidatus Sericytochromatia bacterium]|nr:transcriptional repressor [Candidatus Tanganyikabacteria bacterium]
MHDPIQTLKAHGIQPSAQRVAIAEYVLQTDEHPSAEQVLARVSPHCPMVSRATVYNTLNLFVRKGLLRELLLAEGKVVFDPHVEPHHHFVDDETGAILDVPFEAVAVGSVEGLPHLDVREVQVVMRGRVRRHTRA